jgi:hypothetical protein
VKSRVKEWLRYGGKEEINFKSFVEEGIAAKATGLVENKRREGGSNVEKRIQTRCGGYWRSRVGGNCENLYSRERP